VEKEIPPFDTVLHFTPLCGDPSTQEFEEFEILDNPSRMVDDTASNFGLSMALARRRQACLNRFF
jgi:hypothetical protein